MNNDITINEEIRYLLNNLWVTKNDNREMYYSIKKKQNIIKDYVSKNLGSNLLIQDNFIKLEKIPSVAKENLGIKEFESPLDYVLLCLVLLFLEDKVKDEIFVLTDLVDYLKSTAISLNLNNVPDWNLMNDRKSLSRVINFLVENHVILVKDEDKTGFVNDKTSDALYSVTGLSNYVMRIFNEEIFDYNSNEDFMNNEWSNQDDKKGEVRRYKVYRNILYTPVVYSEDLSLSEIDYLKKLRNHMSLELADLGYDLEVTKNMSLVYEDSSKDTKRGFPNTRKITNIILMVNTFIYELIENKKISLDSNEVAFIPKETLDNILRKVQFEKKAYLNKYFLNLSFNSFCTEVIGAMCDYGFLETKDNGYNVMPMIYRYQGNLINKKESEQIDLFVGEENV